MTNEILKNINDEAEAMGAIAVRGAIRVAAGNRPNEGVISTFMRAEDAAKFGIGRAGTLSCYLDLDTIQALCEEVKLRPMAVASLLVQDVREVATKYTDANGKTKTRISGVLVGIRGVEGGLQTPYNFDNIRRAAELNAKLNAAASAEGGVTLGA